MVYCCVFGNNYYLYSLVIYVKVKSVPFTWKRLMGWILRLQNSPNILYIAVTILKSRIHIFKNRFMWYLVELCYVCWSLIYFPIGFLFSIFNSFFVQWFFPRPHMKNLASIFQRFLILLPKFLMILLIFPYPKSMVKLVFLFAFTIKT